MGSLGHGGGGGGSANPFVLLYLGATPGVAPTFLSIFPTSGSTLGGQNVQVSGTNFRPGATVYFNGVPAASSTFFSASIMLAITPPGVTGLALVAVQNSDGTNTGLEGANAYTYGSGGRMLGFGLLPVAMADADHAVTTAQVNANAIVDCTSTTMTADRHLTFPAPATDATAYDMQVRNSTTTGHNIIVTTGSGTTVSVGPGLSQILTFDPTGVWESVTGA